MNNYSKLYWLTRLDNLQMMLAILFVAAILGIAFSAVGLINSYVDDEKKLTKLWLKRSIIIASISLLGLVFIPDKNDMIMIYTGGKTMDFVQSDSYINKIPAQTTEIITKYLDRQIKSLDSTK